LCVPDENERCATEREQAANRAHRVPKSGHRLGTVFAGRSAHSLAASQRTKHRFRRARGSLARDGVSQFENL
jgi:hypothetical protein